MSQLSTIRIDQVNGDRHLDAFGASVMYAIRIDQVSGERHWETLGASVMYRSNSLSIVRVLPGSKPLLPLQQILHQRLVEAHAGIHRHVVDVRLRAFAAVERL